MLAGYGACAGSASHKVYQLFWERSYLSRTVRPDGARMRCPSTGCMARLGRNLSQLSTSKTASTLLDTTLAYHCCRTTAHPIKQSCLSCLPSRSAAALKPIEAKIHTTFLLSLQQVEC
jgi:hypothetical protein